MKPRADWFTRKRANQSASSLGAHDEGTQQNHPEKKRGDGSEKKNMSPRESFGFGKFFDFFEKGLELKVNQRERQLDNYQSQWVFFAEMKIEISYFLKIKKKEPPCREID